MSCLLKGDLNQRESDDNVAAVSPNTNTPIQSQSSGAGGGTRAGLFRTPISGGVQSATSAHGLPRPALAVRNLMEQVTANLDCISFFVSILIAFLSLFPP